LDDGGLFVPAFREFFLYPTYLHQSEQVRTTLKPSELAQYEWALQGAPSAPTKEISIRLFARITDTHTITNLRQLKRLDSEHIWKPEFLEKRFEWGSEKGLTLLIIRAYVLDPPRTITVKPSFSGCRSWIEEDTEIPATAFRPVLSEEAFLTKRMHVRQALAKK
jgi:hypothetical protein